MPCSANFRALARDEDFMFSPSKLIRWASTPAPKPLSMFITAMPEAQELSMVRSGARPWNACSVAHAGRHGYNRFVHQPSHYGRERAVHARGDNDYPRGIKNLPFA